MGIWDRFLAPWRKSSTTSDEPAQWLIDWVRGGQKTAAGVNVSPDSAMRTSAVWACVRVRSEDVGKLPCILYRKSDSGKERAVDHHLYNLIRSRPNSRMTALDFKQMMQAQLDLRGNALAIKEFDARGRVVALWPVCWTKVTVLCTADDADLFYKINLPADYYKDALPAEAVVHLRGLSLDGKVGLSPIAYQRETIGLAIAAQKYGAEFFGNNAQPLGALKLPTVIGKEAADELRKSYKERHQGKRELAIYDAGMEWVQTGMDNSDAQYLETRGFQNSDIWRIYRVPPHKVGDLTKATFSNIEQQALEYVTDCLMTELVRWEQTLSMSLLTEKEIAAGYFFEFLPDALLRGDLKSRYEAYAIGRNWGWLSVNDIRERENMNHVPNGDIRLQPLNMIEAGTKPPISGTSPDLSPAGAKAMIAQLQVHIARIEAANGHMNGHAG